MKYSQKDLLSEGFWDGFKSYRTNNQSNKKKGFMHNLGRAARWGIRAGAKTLDYIAPELTQPIHKFEGAVRDIIGMKPADSKQFQQNLNATGGTVEFKNKQYLLDLRKGVTPIRNGHYLMKANEINSMGKKSHKVVSLEVDRDFNVYKIS